MISKANFTRCSELFEYLISEELPEHIHNQPSCRRLLETIMEFSDFIEDLDEEEYAQGKEEE